MQLLKVRHVTTYRYRQPVAFGEHRMMFRPRDSYDQKLLEARLLIAPEPVELRWHHDVFGNCVAIARFSGRSKELRFESVIRLDHSPTNMLDFEIADYARSYPFSYSAEEMPDLLRSIERQYLDPERKLDRWARQFLSRNDRNSSYDLLAAMTQAINTRFAYKARYEAGTQDPLRTLALGSGTCRDFALLMMEAARSLGFAARFVSGYLYSPNRQGHAGGGSTHAWLQVYLPGAGWVEFDPTNGIVGNRDLIRVAVVRDPRQAVPLSGTWTGFPSDHLGMDVEVGVTEEHRPAEIEESAIERTSAAEASA
ncbi:MAG: transglutaminase family protein [Alphaproteobacteria bacterium]|nr:transglutaminase family protein [Alphaproteobacteria bacterium]